MTDSAERTFRSHCHHGVWLSEDVCMTCMSLTEGDHWVCNNCAMSGNGLWADGHLRRCAGLWSPEAEREGDYDPIPFLRVHNTYCE